MPHHGTASEHLRCHLGGYCRWVGDSGAELMVPPSTVKRNPFISEGTLGCGEIEVVAALPSAYIFRSGALWKHDADCSTTSTHRNTYVDPQPPSLLVGPQATIFELAQDDSKA